MQIQNNILRHYLKNVLFVCGTACGGKTTVARMLAEKHGFALYDMDQMYDRHRAMADKEHQPNMCYHMQDHHAQWTRNVQEQAAWNMKNLAEQTDMVLLDLIRLSRHETVVADVLYSPVYTRELVDEKQLVFLTVDKSVLRTQYFNRPEKQAFYQFVKAQPLADVYFDNILSGLELTNELEQEAMRQSGLKIIKRQPDDTRESLLCKVELHFGLIK